MQLTKNEYAERATLALVFQLGDCDKLWMLDEADFGDPANKFLLAEMNAMVASGAPLGDATACATWFTAPNAKDRAREELEEDNLAALAAETFRAEVFTAHWEYYLGLLRSERLRRAMQVIAVRLNHKTRDDEPDATLAWLAEQIEAISESYESMI